MKIVRFFSNKEYMGLGQPSPMKKFLPAWYRDSEATFPDASGEPTSGLKRCVPFMDAMISGYALVTPVDIFVSRSDDGNLEVRWNSPEIFKDFISERPKLLNFLIF